MAGRFELDDVRRLLQAKQQEIALTIADLTERPDSSVEPSRTRADRSGLAGERHSRAATVQKFLSERVDVDRALTKTEDGTYGVCDACSMPIPESRLEIRPWAVRCVPCQEVHP
jgi:DnaK suppressor protein